MRYISLALLLMLVVLATISHYGTNASSCEHSGNHLGEHSDLEVDEMDESCSRSSSPKIMGETEEDSEEKVADSADPKASNLPQESFFSKLKRVLSFLYQMIMWYVNSFAE